jgi:hypothetical protein
MTLVKGMMMENEDDDGGMRFHNEVLLQELKEYQKEIATIKIKYANNYKKLLDYLGDHHDTNLGDC